MRLGFVLTALCGVVVMVLLVVHEGAGAVFGMIAPLGWLLAPVVVFHLVPVLLSAAAWRRAVAPRDRRALPTFVTLRTIREGINNLLPVAQIGGDMVGARLLGVRGVPPAMAVASVVVDFTLELATLGVFILIGLALLALGNHGAAVNPLMIAGIAAATVAAIAGFALSQRAGLFDVIDHLLRRLAQHSASLPFAGIKGLSGFIRARYRDHSAMVDRRRPPFDILAGRRRRDLACSTLHGRPHWPWRRARP